MGRSEGGHRCHLLGPLEANGDHFREEEEEEEDEPIEDEDSDEDEPEKGEAPKADGTDDGDDELDSEQMEEGVDENGLGVADLAAPRSEIASQACRFGGGRMYTRRSSSSYNLKT